MSARPDFTFSDEMVERAANALRTPHPRDEPTLNDIARRVLEEAFDGVPATNYGIGLALQFFDLVICVKDGDIMPRAGVYRSAGPDRFDALGHTLDVNWGHEPARYIKRVQVGKIDPPAPPGDGGSG